MKSVLKFLLIAAGVLGLSIVVTPILFKFLPFKFEKIFNRVVTILSIAAIVIFVRFDRKKLTEYGLFTPDPIFKLMAFGFLGGLIILFSLSFVKLGAGAAFWEVKAFSMKWISKPLSAVFAAFLIGFIEEIFFRGFIFRTLKENLHLNLFLALVVTSAFYSILHFVSVTKPYIGPDPGISDSLKLVAAPFGSLGNWDTYWRGFVGLFIFGLVLNGLVLRSQSLFASIGLHAGCVFFLKTEGLWIRFSNDYPLLWGSGKMYDSIAGWLFLGILGGAMILWVPKFRTNPVPVPKASK